MAEVAQPGPIRLRRLDRRLVRLISANPLYLRSHHDLGRARSLAVGCLLGPLVTVGAFFAAATLEFGVPLQWAAVPAIFLWLMLFAFELSVASQPSPPLFRDRLRKVLPRAAVILVASLLFGEIVVQATMENSIEDRVMEIRRDGAAAAADATRANAPEHDVISDLKAQQHTARRRYQDLQSTLTAAQADVDHFQGLIDQETAGELGGRPPGCGSACGDKMQQLHDAEQVRDAARQELDSVGAGLQHQIRTLDERIAEQQDQLGRRIERERRRREHARPSFEERVQALNDITIGHFNPGFLALRLGITSFLFLLEAWVVFLKLAPQCAHDRMVLAAERVSTAEVEAALLGQELAAARQINDHRSELDQADLTGYERQVFLAEDRHGLEDARPAIRQVAKDWYEKEAIRRVIERVQRMMGELFDVDAGASSERQNQQ